MPENNGSKIPPLDVTQGGDITFQAVACKMVFEVINRSEEDLDVKDELLGHPDSVQVLSIADLSQHIRDAGSA
jgi:hypothetical protein